VFFVQLQFAFNMFPHEIPRNFNMEYKCYSVSMMPGQERQDVEQGGKSMCGELYRVRRLSWI